MAAKRRARAHALNAAFLLVSLVLHVMLLTGVALYDFVHSLWLQAYGLGGGLELQVPEPVRITSFSVTFNKAEFVRPSDKPGLVSLKRILRLTEEELAKLSDEEKERLLREKLASLSNIEAGDVNKIALAVEKFKGVPSTREYAPREGVEGPFHTNSALLYDVRRFVRESGEVVYLIIMVDKDGRQLVDTVKEEDMTSELLTAYRIFELGRDNPSLRRLIEAARRLNAGSEEPPASPPPVPEPQKEPPAPPEEAPPPDP